MIKIECKIKVIELI